MGGYVNYMWLIDTTHHIVKECKEGAGQNEGDKKWRFWPFSKLSEYGRGSMGLGRIRIIAEVFRGRGSAKKWPLLIGEGLRLSLIKNIDIDIDQNHWHWHWGKKEIDIDIDIETRQLSRVNIDIGIDIEVWKTLTLNWTLTLTTENNWHWHCPQNFDIAHVCPGLEMKWRKYLRK